MPRTHHDSTCRQSSFTPTSCGCGFTAEFLARGGRLTREPKHKTYTALRPAPAGGGNMADGHALARGLAARCAALPPNHQDRL